VRAIVPLAKGTEVLFSYMPHLHDRAARRESLDSYGFVCNCELCALPDHLSNALDTKIKKARIARRHVKRFYNSVFKEGKDWYEERDAIHALRHFDIYMSTIIRERLFYHYDPFDLPIEFFHIFGKKAVLQRVGQAVLNVLHRHLGTGVCGDGMGVDSVSWLLEQLQLHMVDSKKYFIYMESKRSHILDAQIENTASSIISCLQSLP
jgi:hypothetical protein